MKHRLWLVLAMAFTLSACQSAYYGAWEKVGVHKRDIMVDRVEDAKEAQEEAQQEFSSALEEMQAMLGSDGGDLQRAYEKAADEYESAASAAENVTERINGVESVAEALFDEWQQEIGEISKASLRNTSQRQLRDTQRNYQNLIRSMRRAESKMTPVLTTMKDNMLYLKHNLNARTIGAIEGEFNSLKQDIDGLIKEMNKSIQESNKFIESMQSS
ncbi:DUF2959 domain-containing protein [Paraferrimonas sedimenticola]|uniref:DUF2959 domain-containing protein n=1 Tax=Paraferrimonas sedimenticola TaxID=375674 RepID=A0AA37RUF2_9GAMM|nr:DUF2959 domain-containing protein [Paraferrimonas sedimenticola]GLP95374.1 DUF2959 domain-containing protein [Paraferrimonas sedimenticola]